MVIVIYIKISPSYVKPSPTKAKYVGRCNATTKAGSRCKKVQEGVDIVGSTNKLIKFKKNIY